MIANSARRDGHFPAAKILHTRGVTMGQLGIGVAMKLKDVRRPVPVSERIGVEFPRYFTSHLEAGKTPYDEVKWDFRTASIGNDKGAVIFEQRDVEVPIDWSQTATNIVVSKYF
jgi:ribonucleoside-diphosphate reductase alpha chain